MIVSLTRQHRGAFKVSRRAIPHVEYSVIKQEQILEVKK